MRALKFTTFFKIENTEIHSLQKTKFSFKESSSVSIDSTISEIKSFLKRNGSKLLKIFVSHNDICIETKKIDSGKIKDAEVAFDTTISKSSAYTIQKYKDHATEKNVFVLTYIKKTSQLNEILLKIISAHDGYVQFIPLIQSIKMQTSTNGPDAKTFIFTSKGFCFLSLSVSGVCVFFRSIPLKKNVDILAEETKTSRAALNNGTSYSAKKIYISQNDSKFFDLNLTEQGLAEKWSVLEKMPSSELLERPVLKIGSANANKNLFVFLKDVARYGFAFIGAACFIIGAIFYIQYKYILTNSNILKNSIKIQKQKDPTPILNSILFVNEIYNQTARSLLYMSILTKFISRNKSIGVIEYELKSEIDLDPVKRSPTSRTKIAVNSLLNDDKSDDITKYFIQLQKSLNSEFGDLGMSSEFIKSKPIAKNILESKSSTDDRSFKIVLFSSDYKFS